MSERHTFFRLITVRPHLSNRLWWILLLPLTIPVLLPLVQSGFFVSDDGLFHIYRIAALANAWSRGVLHPRLFPDFGFGYGQAILNFYSPLSYWPGAATSLLGNDPVVATKMVIATGFILAAMAMYGYVRRLWGPWAALLAAVAYTYFPYHIADVYVRGAIPEHFAFIFPPLILWAYTSAMKDRRPASGFLWGTLAWVGLVLTHNLTALLMAPVTIAYLLVMAFITTRWQRLWAALGSLILAVAMSAAYWLPVLVESSTVGLALGPSTGYENHMLALGKLIGRSLLYIYRDENGFALVYPVSWLTAALLLCVVGLIAVRWRQRRLPSESPILIFHTILSLLSLFMITSLSLMLWYPLTPVLGHLQYPWRFLLLTAIGSSVAVGGLVILLPKIRPVILLAGVTVISMLVFLTGMPFDVLDISPTEARTPQRMWDEDAAAGQVGATWTGEFLPLTVTEQRWALGRRREGAVDGNAISTPNIQLEEVGYGSLTARIKSAVPLNLSLHQFAQPGWNVLVDGQPIRVSPSGEMGLLSAAIPAGTHMVELTYGRSPARIAGGILSVLAAVSWIILAWRYGKSRGWLRVAAIGLLIITIVLVLNNLGVGRQTQSPQPSQTQFDDVALLIGSETGPVAGESDLEISLYWFALREMATDYKAFIHIVDGAGQVIAQHDSHPVGGYTPTSRWQPGEIILDRHVVSLPFDLPPGEYKLKAGLYELQESAFRNLSTTPPTPDNRVDLGSLTLP